MVKKDLLKLYNSDIADLDKIKTVVLPILKNAWVTKSSIFGSYARGDFNEQSDVDMLVELPKDSSLLDLVRLERKLIDVLNIKVDLLTFNSVNPLLKEYIFRDQIQIL